MFKVAPLISTPVLGPPRPASWKTAQARAVFASTDLIITRRICADNMVVSEGDLSLTSAAGRKQNTVGPLHPQILCYTILYKGPGHPQIWGSSRVPETNPPQTLRGNYGL